MLFVLPEILLDIPRNPVFAVGIPIVLGTLSGIPTKRQVRGQWYKVCQHSPMSLVELRELVGLEFDSSPRTSPQTGLSVGLDNALRINGFCVVFSGDDI